MARRKTTAADIGCLAVAALLVALAILGPLTIAAWSIYCELRSLRYRHARSAEDVLSVDEQGTIMRAEEQVQLYENRIAQAMNSGIALGYARRADGLFDARRFDARRLNATVEALQSQRDDALAYLSHIENTLGRKLGRWLNAMSSLIGSRAGIITFGVCFVAITAMTGGSLEIADLLFGGALDEPGARLGTSFVSVAFAALAMFVGGSVARSSLAA